MEKKKNNIYFKKQATNGRPRLILNKEGKETIEKLAAMMCTDEEIASVLGVSVETLQTESNLEAFSEYKKRGQNKGKASLRRSQFKAAENGNATILVWLGKQYLDQRDRQDVTVDSEQDYTINIYPASSHKKDADVE